MTEQLAEFPIGQPVTLKGHFEGEVRLEGVRQLGNSFECLIRLLDGSLEEVVISQEEAEVLRTDAKPVEARGPVDPEKLRLLVESARIRLAYAYDKHFAVSLSGIRTLPHQIEAVYQKMLPQPRLRFLLADDPGAGKTIMAGLLIKEMRLREAIDRILILCPAPLTIQWQDELLRWFGEPFDIIFSAVDQQQLVNPWQRSAHVIASLDYAKQEGVRERVWQQRWDLVIIDEAHKCSAFTRQRTDRAFEVEETRRYQLAKRLTAQADHVLLLTATPHHGDDDRFGHFLRLLDPDLFPEPHRLGEQATAIRRGVFQLGADCPWALRRLKEDLRDLNGRRLFPDRHTYTVTFSLNSEEYQLYKLVSEYINRFLGQTTGARRQSAALARTVFQRRLASSAQAIYESLARRQEKQKGLLEEIQALPPSQRTRHLAQLQGRLVDAEVDEDDLDDSDKDDLFDQFTTAVEIDQLADEVATLKDLVDAARRVRDQASDSKLASLRECLRRAQFEELKDGRGKLIIFSEHRATVRYLREHLARWGYTTCEINGGMNPHQRKRAQEEFRTAAQICVATEAAGEGINLQFCHLMINYDMPWNPTRLEQRLGRIHRIGQEREVHAFNFVATESEDGQPVIEGRILHRLLEKLDQMRAALGNRVFDVIGEVLSLNDINLPEMLRNCAYDPRRLHEYIDQIDRMDPAKLKAYEEATGIALARANVDFSAFQAANHESEERRLMPKYVEKYFEAAAKEVGLRLGPRADGLWRAEYVPADLRSDKLQAVQHFGKPEASYRKITFHKEHLDQDAHLDAVLVGPGHPLYATVDEKLNQVLAPLAGQPAAYIDPLASGPYVLYFFEVSLRGQNSRGDTLTLHAEVVAVKEEAGQLEVVPPDILLNLPGWSGAAVPQFATSTEAAADQLKSTYQLEARQRVQEERTRFAAICRDYLQRSFEARIRAAQDRVMSLRARERENTEYALARQRAGQDLADLERTRQERLESLNRLAIARTGPIKHLATAIVLTPAQAGDPLLRSLVEELDPNVRRQSELAAEDHVVSYEASHGRESKLVGHLKIGFDIRSWGVPDPATGQYEVRRIEVKGRASGQAIRLTTNEWYKAEQLGESYWLYVVWDPLSPNPELHIIQNPARVLDHAKREVLATRFFEIGCDAIIMASKHGAI